MDKILRGLPLFYEVARQKSFSRASEVLDVPLPSLSRRVAALEKELGVQLLNRTTRSVGLTESGKAFFQGCDYILSELDILRERIVMNEKKATGRVRVSVPTDIYYRFLRGVFGDFARLHPGIELQVLFSPRWVDLHTDPFDLEIRIGPLPDSDLKVRKLATVHANIYASPEFLEYHPLPKQPQEISRLPFIWLYQIDHYRLDLVSGKKQETVFVRPAHIVSNVALGLELMLAGQGLLLLETELGHGYVQEGTAVCVLPEWRTSSVEISVVMAMDRVPQRIRIFIDYLAGHFARMSQNGEVVP